MKNSARSKMLLRKMARREITEPEKTELEQMALEDPFLQDALDGYASLGGTHQSNLSQLEEKIKSPSGRYFNWIAIAATLLLLISISWFLMRKDLSPNADLLVLDKEHTSDDLPESEDVLAQQGGMAPTATEKISRNLPSTNEQENDALDLANIEPAASATAAESKSAAESVTPLGLNEEESAFSDQSSDSEIAADVNSNTQVPKRQFSELIRIEGLVFDDVGEPLVGVHIKQQNHNIGVATDLDGRFILLTPDTNEAISFSYAGYQTRVISQGITPAEPMQVRLTPQPGNLTEVVANDYSSSRKKKEPSVLDAAGMLIPVVDYKEFDRYLRENLRYPIQATENNVAGPVILDFTIDDKGQPIDIKISKSLGYGCDAEAIRLLQNGPHWKPNKISLTSQIRGKITVNFRID